MRRNNMTTLHLRKSSDRSRLRLAFPLIPLALCCFALSATAQGVIPAPDGGYAGGNTASNINLPEQNIVTSTPFQPGAATHETRADPEAALRFPNANQIAPEIELVSSAPPTRSSFMATWDNVTGATGYLLDVSTSSTFSSYVEGYHDWDVGNGTGRVVTGLNSDTTYYYRVRPYTVTVP